MSSQEPDIELGEKGEIVEPTVAKPVVHFADEHVNIPNNTPTDRDAKSIQNKDTASISSSSSDSSASSNASSSPSINVNSPGAWALYHHKDNLVSEIRIPGPHGILGWLKRSKNYLDDKLVRNRRQGRSSEGEEDDLDFEDRRFRMSLAELQRMKLRKVQMKLVGNIASMVSSQDNQEADKWEESLRDYVQSMQEYDYMISRSKGPSDPFLVTGERWVDHIVLQSAMDNFHDHFALGAKYKKRGSIAPWAGEENPAPIGETRSVSVKTAEWEAFRRRLAMALFAGTSLIGPMWLIVLYPAKYTALITTTIMVSLFGLIMARSLDKEMDVMSSTAAYAAVLVVFVGLTTTA